VEAHGDGVGTGFENETLVPHRNNVGVLCPGL
jgi:hypothetical protein